MTTLPRRLEVLSDRLLRSPGARYAGIVVALGAVAFLVRSLVRLGEDALAWFVSVTPLQLAAVALGLIVFHVGSIVTLRPIFGGPALHIWGAAQLVKYLPVPGSAVIGVVGSTVRSGGTSRHGVAVTIRHALLHVGAATVVGVLAVAPAAHELLGIPVALTVVAGVLGGVGTSWLGVRHLPLVTSAWAIAAALATWALMGVLLWVGVAQGAGADAWDIVRLSTAFAAGWVVGQLALPVPAGIGVREFALVLLLTPVVGEAGALSFALGTRVAHVAGDATLSLLLLTTGGWRAARSRDAEPGAVP